MKKLLAVAAFLLAAALFTGAGYPAEHIEYTVAQDNEGPHPANPEEWSAEIEYIAKTVWGEARGCDTTQQAAVIWCILNRVDAGDGDIIEVITASGQFNGYMDCNPAPEELKDLAADVISRWLAEKEGFGIMAQRVLPAEYLWFTGRGGVNWFRDAYEGGTIWDWSLESPYEGGGTNG